MINKRILLAVVAAIGLGLVTAGAASAQAYPSRPIKIIEMSKGESVVIWLVMA